MADERMTANQRAWLSWGRRNGHTGGGRACARSVVSPRHPAAAWLADQLHRVLAGPGGLTVAYQPIYDLETESVVGVEALARLSEFPDVASDVWLTQAAALGIGVGIEMAVVRRVLIDLPRVPRPISVSVNLSTSSLVDRRLAPLMRAAGRDLDRLVLEVADDGRTDWLKAVNAAAPFRRAGVRLAVDDADLRHVVGIQPDVIKLDAAVVRSVERDTVRRTLVSAVVLLAGDMGAVVSAEAIESADELEVLRSLGVHRGQGFHLGRPASLPWTVGALVGEQRTAVLV